MEQMRRLMLSVSSGSIKIILCSFGLAAFMLLNFFFYTAPSGLAGYVNYVLTACVLGICFAAYGRHLSTNVLMVVLICFAAFVSIQLLNFRLGRLSNFIVPFYNLLLAFVVATKRIYAKPLYFAYYLIAFYIVYRVVVLGIDPDEVFTHASRNMISTIAVMYAVLIYLILFLNHNKIVVWPALVAFLLSAIGIGRSGIICSLLLLIGVVTYKYGHAEKKQRKWYIGGIFFIIGGSVYFFRDFFSGGELEFVSRLQTYGLNDPARAQLLEQYINHIDFYNFFRGYDIMNDFIYNSWHNNPHNSWIYLHYNLGIWGVVLGMLIFISGLNFLVKKHYLIVLLLGVVILRSATDSILFFTSYDFIIYSFIILAFTRKNGIERKNTGRMFQISFR